jgi:hypothetical protein
MGERLVARLLLAGLWAGTGAWGACRSGAPPVSSLTVSKETTYITEPLRADGTPDYAAWLNRKHSAGVTPENNAALVLRAIEPAALREMGVDERAAPEPALVRGGLRDLQPLEEHLKRKLDPQGEVPGIGPLPPDLDGAFTAQHGRAMAGPWRPADAPLVAAWLQMNEASLARIEEATRTRTRFFVPVPGDLAFDMKLPSLLGFRVTGNALRVRALASAAWGDRAAARRDVVAGLRLASLLEQGPWLIDRLVAVALRGIAAEPVVALADPAAPAAARDLLNSLKQVPASVPIDDVLDVNERLVFLAGYVDLYRAGRTSARAWEDRMTSLLAAQEEMARGLGLEPPSPAWRKIQPWAVDWDELLSTVNRCWQNPGCKAELSAAKEDLEPALLDDLVAKAGRDKEARRRVTRVFLWLQERGSLSRAGISWNEAEAILRLARVSAAGAVLRAEAGRYPSGGAALAREAGLDPRADLAGYSFDYWSDGSRFAIAAWPQRSGETGVRRFCADDGGRLVFTTDGPPPSTEDGRCDTTARVLVARTPPGY